MNKNNIDNIYYMDSFYTASRYIGIILDCIYADIDVNDSFCLYFWKILIYIWIC